MVSTDFRIDFVDPTTPAGQQRVRDHAAALFGPEGERGADLTERPDFFFAAEYFLGSSPRMIRYALLTDPGMPVAMIPVEIGRETNLPGSFSGYIAIPRG